MSAVLVLDGAQTRQALDGPRLLPGLRSALVAISRNLVSAPPRIAAITPSGILGVMPGFVADVGLAAKVVSVFPRGVGAAGRSAHRGVVALFDEKDGQLVALMDAESLTAIRTAATATIAMQVLARPESQRITIIGTGAQARAQIDILAAINPSLALVVCGRDSARAREAAVRHPGGSVETIEAAVKGADVVFCCTDARAPVINRSWISDGVHVSSVGGSHGPELDVHTVQDGTLFVEWPGAVSESPPAGAYELRGIDTSRATMIGAVIDGVHPGRTSPDEVTVFKSTGHAALDVAAAASAYTFASAHRLGHTVEM